MKLKRLINKINILKENNTRIFIFIVIILTNVFSIVFSSILLYFLPENDGRSFFELLRFAFTLMINPSGRYIYSDYPASLIITTCVVLIGMISLTGGTVGYVTDLIRNIIERSANSKTSLKLYDHIVILNYNHKVPSMLSNFSFDDDIKNTCVVILSPLNKDKIKKEIDSVIESDSLKNKFGNIIIRNGDPKSKIDLDKISLYNAKSVFIMSPDDNDNDSSTNLYFDTAKIYMYISWYFSDYIKKKKNDYHKKTEIIVETEQHNIDEIIKNYHNKSNDNLSISPVNCNELLGKLMAMIAVMPTLKDTLMHILSFEGVELYLKKALAFSIKEDILVQNTAIPLYDLEKDGQKYRVYIAENEKQISVKVPNTLTYSNKLSVKPVIPNIKRSEKNIIIIGVNSKLGYILDGLTSYKNEYSDSTLQAILVDTVENEEKLLEYYENERFKEILNSDKQSPLIIQNIQSPVEELQNLGLEGVNSILFLSEETDDYSKIDEKPLFFWSNVNNMKEKLLKDRNLIVEILDPKNKEIIEGRNQDRVIISDKFLSCMYALISKDPKRLEVVKDLLTFGNEPVIDNQKVEMRNRVNLLSINVQNMFEGIDITSLKFKSKRDFIAWTYEITGNKYIPIGCIKNNIEYLFSRIDNDNDEKQNLDHAFLFVKDENQNCIGKIDELTFNKNDEILVVQML